MAHLPFSKVLLRHMWSDTRQFYYRGTKKSKIFFAILQKAFALLRGRVMIGTRGVIVFAMIVEGEGLSKFTRSVFSFLFVGKENVSCIYRE